MTMFVNILLFVLGLALVVKGGDFFVDASVWIAKAMRIPTFIIGATIVSLATTMPEMLVSAIGAAQGDTAGIEMAIGNAVGSVTANTAMILAISMVCLKINCPRKQYIKQCCILVGTGVVIMIASLLGGESDGHPYSLHIAGSIVLVCMFAYFMFENIREARAVPERKEEKEPIAKKDLWIHILLFVLGTAGIVGGSRLMVDYGEKIAQELGVPDRIIAVTLVAVGTSLPELVTTITAIVKKEAALSIGNIIGANIIDMSLILPICSLISGKALPVPKESLIFDIPICIVITLIAVVPMLIRQKTSKAQGIALLTVYAGYLGYLIYSVLAN